MDVNCLFTGLRGKHTHKIYLFCFLVFLFVCACVWSQHLARAGTGCLSCSLSTLFAESCSLTEHRTSQACPQRFPVSSSRVQGLQEVHQSHVVLRGCWILTVPILLVWQALYPFTLLGSHPPSSWSFCSTHSGRVLLT